MRRVSDLLPPALQRSRDRELVLASVVLDAVASAITATLPAPLARRVRPSVFRDGTVTVQAEGSVVASETRLLAERILPLAERTLRRRGFRTQLRELRVRVVR